MTNSITEIQTIIDKYKAGHRYFVNLDFDKGEKLTEQILAGTIFENCYFSVDFSNSDFTNSKFLNCNLKGCNFKSCNLTNTTFEGCALECAEFKYALIDKTCFTDCYCYSQKVALNKETGELASIKHLLVKELYGNIPEFMEMVSHFSNDEMPYSVYGDFGNKLFKDIIANNETSDFTKKCFQFLNLLGDRKDGYTDNLLVVGVYEELYPSKKCNDIARHLLTGRNKDIYEYWMVNGGIRAEY